LKDKSQERKDRQARRAAWYARREAHTRATSST
jgi:hypothetical protein